MSELQNIEIVQTKKRGRKPREEHFSKNYKKKLRELAKKELGLPKNSPLTKVFRELYGEESHIFKANPNKFYRYMDEFLRAKEEKEEEEGGEPRTVVTVLRDLLTEPAR